MAQFRKDTQQYLGDNKTLFEVVMLADQYGNRVGPSNPTGMAVDAFGRSRISQPVTLFDSTNRFQLSPAFSNALTGTGAVTHDANASTALLNVTASGDKVVRESNRVFAYQPGKSLQILTTFVMNAAATGLRQRVGYFNDQNGIFLEQTGTTIRFVLRSYVNGSVSETYATKGSWSLDNLDGNGPSHLTLDLTKAQIFFTDIEWLGVGSVRVGFVINGQLIHCHTFHHANVLPSTYMTTACLPLRAEIENVTNNTAATLKQICTTVVSEGGYELRGRPRTWGMEPTTAGQYQLGTIGTYYPVMSFRLHPNRIDSIVVPRALSLSPINNGTYKYKLLSGATIGGATWANTATNDYLQYNSNTSATFSGGVELASGYVTATTQASSVFSLDSGIFTYQFERNGLTATPTTFTLAVTCGTAATANVVSSLDWHEVV